MIATPSTRMIGAPCLRLPAAVLALAACLGAAPPAPAKVEVQVAITGLRSTEGLVRACLTADRERFPSWRGADAVHAVTLPAAEAQRLAFSDVSPGTYAIALLHDENGNGKADRVLGMMPREGFGFSRDAKVRMGPPDFADAAFAVGEVPVRQTIRMRYML